MLDTYIEQYCSNASTTRRVADTEDHLEQIQKYKEGNKSPDFDPTYIKHDCHTKLQCSHTRFNSIGIVERCSYIQR